MAPWTDNHHLTGNKVLLACSTEGLPDKMLALSVRMCWRGVVPAHFPVIQFSPREIMMYLG